MSCQIDIASAVIDVTSVHRLLFPERSKDDEVKAKVEDDWNWDTDNDEQRFDNEADGMQSKFNATEDRQHQSFSWLQECVVSISPVGDVLVIARNRTLVWLNHKWDNDASRANFVVVRSDTIIAETDDDQQDFITAVLCLPLASQRRSAHGRQDWTAVLVGFRLGNVRIYTESGTLLLVQRFDQSPVSNLKCRSFEPPRYNAMAEQHEELLIVYKKSIVIVQGLGLYQTLRACRNQAAKAVAAGGDSFEAPPLEYKKWALHGHDDVNDCESIGTLGTTAFDRLVTESIHRWSGSGASGLLMAPRNVSSSAGSLFVATGTCPYVAFYYAVEGSAPLLVSEAMMVAAQKLSSYFTGFFVGSRTQVEKKQPPKLEPATSLPSRFELRDLRRSGLTICASPNRRLSAVTDDFGRVIIVDNIEGMAVRVFKGYREAQCGWIEVDEEHYNADNSPSKCRVALFLVIYSRRRGILEVWTAQQGPRVAAFSVGKTATLVYCNHSILGATSVKTVMHSWSQSNRCFLIESDGVIRTITVPFHCALRCDRDKARDLHLLEKVRQELDACKRTRRRQDKSSDTATKVADVILDMKTFSVRQQTIELVLKSDDIDGIVISEVVKRLLDDLRLSAGDSMESESLFLVGHLRRVLQLLPLHEEVLRLSDSSSPFGDAKKTSNDDSEEKPLQALSAMLHLSESEVDRLLTKVDRYFCVLDRRKRIRFKDTHGPLGAGAFITCFETNNVSHVEERKADNVNDECGVLPVCLDPELSKESFANLARFLFTPLLKSECSCSPDFLTLLLNSGIDKNQLLLLLIESWLNLDEGWSAWLALCNFHAIVIFLSSQSDSADNSSVITGYNEVSPWWSSLRSRLRRTEIVAAALTASLVCRGASITLVITEQQDICGERKTGIDDAAEFVCLSDWEGVHLDTEQWSLLVKQLEDLVSLATLVYGPIVDSELTYNTVIRPVRMTVDSFLERGRGGISELVSQWLTRLDITTLMAAFDPLTDCEASPNSDLNIKLSVVRQVKDILDETRIHFPTSLQRDILLTNCAWEFAALWNANKEEIQWLDGCVSSLSVCTPYRRALASHLWHTFFSKTFFATAQLIEKVGKAPKERLCWKNLNMSDTVLEKFLNYCERLLDILVKIKPVICIDDDEDRISVPVTVTLPYQSFRCEEPWQDTNGPAPLVDVVMELRSLNDDLVSRHRDLVVVMCAVLTFSLRSCRPLSLYDTRSKSFFFVDFYSTIPLPKETPDLSIINLRTQFLFRVISAVVQTIPESSGSIDDSVDGRTSTSTLNANAVTWFGRVIALGTSWRLDADQLRRHLVCELYSNGFDSMAEEVLPSVVNCQAMGSQLILIAGRRVCQTLQSSSETFVQNITLFSPAVTAWLKSLGSEGENQCRQHLERPIGAATIPLLTYIVNAIPENHSEHKLALNLMEGLQQLLMIGYSMANGEQDNDVTTYASNEIN